MPVWVFCIRESETVMRDVWTIGSTYRTTQRFVWLWPWQAMVHWKNYPNVCMTMTMELLVHWMNYPNVCMSMIMKSTGALKELPKCLYDYDCEKHWCIERTTQMFVWLWLWKALVHWKNYPNVCMSMIMKSTGALKELPKCLYDYDCEKHWCIERTTQMFVWLRLWKALVRRSNVPYWKTIAFTNILHFARLTPTNIYVYYVCLVDYGNTNPACTKTCEALWVCLRMENSTIKKW